MDAFRPRRCDTAAARAVSVASRLQTAVVAAAAALAMDIDRDVAQFAAQAAVPYKNASAVDNAEAESLADVQHSEVGDAVAAP